MIRIYFIRERSQKLNFFKESGMVDNLLIIRLVLIRWLWV
jgi:hypothetical protein